MKNYLTKIVYFFVCTGFLISISSCESRPKGVLNKNEMTNILVEMHKFEGAIEVQGIYTDQSELKNKYYKSILEKYNTSQAQFDSSLVWYTKNPKRFDKIYEDVFAQLTTLQEDVRNGKFHPIDSVLLLTGKINIWNKLPKYKFSKDSTRTKLNFEIINSDLLYGDVYFLKFLQQIAPEDSSQNQQIKIRINYFNGMVDSVTLKTFNDSLLRRYTIRIPMVKKLKIKSISGELLASSMYKGNFNSLTDSISLIRQYRTDWQDSLRKEVEKTDTIIYQNTIKLKQDSLNKFNKLK